MNASKRLAPLATILMLAALSSCAHNAPAIRTTEAACADLQPLSYFWSPHCEAGDPDNLCDSEQTVRQIEAFNAYIGGLCNE